MNIDTEHLHHWMNAIRVSNSPMRTLDAFWSGQIKSKEWLISNLLPFIQDNNTIEIHGGWVGTLASMLFQSTDKIKHITSIDIDPLCKHVAEEMNRIEYHQNKFSAVTSDMTKYQSNTDIIVNTSFEHITEEQYDAWKSKLPSGQLVVLQSNNYDIPEHIRTAQSLEDFVQQTGLSNILFKGQLELPLYTRFMIIASIANK